MTNRITKSIKFPEDLVEAIEKYRKENFIGSFSAALYELVRKGLQQYQRENNRD